MKIEEVTAADGDPDLLISLDESKIEGVGVRAIGEFLRKLQVRLKFLKEKAAKKTTIFHWPNASFRPQTAVKLLGVCGTARFTAAPCSD